MLHIPLSTEVEDSFFFPVKAVAATRGRLIGKTRPPLGAQPRDLFKLSLLVVWRLSPTPSNRDEPLTASYLAPKNQILAKVITEACA